MAKRKEKTQDKVFEDLTKGPEALGRAYEEWKARQAIPAEESLATLDGIRRHLIDIAEDPETKRQDALRAIHELAELQGFRSATDLSDLKNRSNEELFQLYEDSKPAFQLMTDHVKFTDG